MKKKINIEIAKKRRFDFIIFEPPKHSEALIIFFSRRYMYVVPYQS